MKERKEQTEEYKKREDQNKGFDPNRIGEEMRSDQQEQNRTEVIEVINKKVKSKNICEFSEV